MEDKCCYRTFGHNTIGDKLFSFTVKSWNSFCLYLEKWKNLDGRERTLADRFLCAPTPKEHCKFHRSCYQSFTSARRISQAEKRIMVLGPQRIHTDARVVEVYAEQEDVALPPSPKRLRSDNDRCVLKTSSRRNQYVFPVVCVFRSPVSSFVKSVDSHADVASSIPRGAQH
eukprot:TRINITY_DN49700_c0_g2_i1.p1 TRINITY_DN49700_c0_g2~~TRINITY_DN49700_c0_g2_i1.p1  ORF type:complete len:171 (-),score=4.33 TRINITY_DN49700_c0_g2_i1:4-516(-)